MTITAAQRAAIKAAVTETVSMHMWLERQERRAREYRRMVADVQGNDAVKAAGSAAQWQGYDGIKVVTPL